MYSTFRPGEIGVAKNSENGLPRFTGYEADGWGTLHLEPPSSSSSFSSFSLPPCLPVHRTEDHDTFWNIMNQWKHVKAQRHWNYIADRSQSDKQKGKSFQSLGKTFCARLLHQQTRLRLMHCDRAHPSTTSIYMIQATRWNHHHVQNWPPLLRMTSAERRFNDISRNTNAPAALGIQWTR